MVQGGAPKIAKLVFKRLISGLTMTGGAHPVNI